MPKRAGEVGMGLGVLLADTILEMYQGALRVDDPGPRTTSLSLLIPLLNPE